MSEARSTSSVCLERAGELIRAATPPASLQEHLEGRARLIAAVDKMRKPVARWRPLNVGLVAFGVVISSLLVLVARTHMLSSRAPIAWRLENGAVGAQGYVSIPASAPVARLVFDEGSSVALAPGSRGRVAATTATGAEVVLEQGRAAVHVVHREHSSWLVDAGPFAVRVTGTDFLVAWAADSEMLDVWMRNGKVLVRGPVLGDAQPLSAGQHLRARLRDATVLIDNELEPADSLTSASQSAPVRADAAPVGISSEPPAGNTSPASTPVVAPSTWSRLVAAGDFARVVREAESEGLSRVLTTRPLPDLRALGDAARYANDSVVAKRAYLAVRSRFPAGCSDSRTAAFLLGRLAEEQEHAPGEAVRWYDRYLADAPAGEFAGNALGRKMLIVSKAAGPDAAKPLAQRYLQRFPAGAYEATARELAP